MSLASTLLPSSLEFKSGATCNVKLTSTSQNVLTLSGDGEVELRGVSLPTQTTSAATKGYVDALASGLKWKQSVRAATTTAGTLASSFSAGQTIDGVLLVLGDRLLIKDQATASENGIYYVESTGAPTRSTDMSSGLNSASMAVFVEEGTINDNQSFVVTNDSGSDVIGTNDITFVQFSGTGQIIAGNGITKSGNQIDVSVDDVGIKVISDTLQIGTDGVKRDNIDFGTSATEVAADALPLNTFSWTSIVAPSQTEDALQKIDTKIADIVGGGTAVTMTNGNATTGQTGHIDVSVDDSTLEIQGVLSSGSDVLAIKDAGVTNAKLTNPSLTVTAGNALTGGGAVSLGGSTTLNVAVDDSSLEVFADALRVKSSGVSNTMLANPSLTVAAGDGLQTGGSVALGSTVTVDVDATVVRTSGNQSIAGIKIFSDATDATSSTSGGFIVSGGMACAKAGVFGGSVSAASHISTSDPRLKTDVEEVKAATSKISQLQPVYFNWIDRSVDTRRHCGLMADKVKDIEPDAVCSDTGTFLSVDYNHICMLLLASHKELMARVEHLESLSAHVEEKSPQ